MKEIHEIVNRLMYSLGYKTKKSLAEALKISPSDLNNRINSGTIKQLLIDLAIHKNVNIDWLLTGKENQSKVSENTVPYSRGPGQTHQCDIGQLIIQTTEVLQSNTKYGKALKENIEAFHQAVNEQKKQDDPPDAAGSGSSIAAPKKAAR
jgi:hypothetical protein